MILIFVIISTLLGDLYGNFKEPVYMGSVLISPAKIAGVFVANPSVTVTKLNMNSYYSKETFLNCNPDFYKDKDKDKDINYDISALMKASVTRDGDLLLLQMQDKNKTVINDCLSSIIDDIRTSQSKIADPSIKLKITQLRLAEERFKNAEGFKSKLQARLVTGYKTIGEVSSVDLGYANMLISINKEIKENLNEINSIKFDLSEEQTKPAYNVLPINIEEKPPLAPKLWALIGLFLGLCLGILFALIKQMKI
jgi:hypothetical protein